MFNRRTIQKLLEKYESDLNVFQGKVTQTATHILRSDYQFVPNILMALQAIVNGKEFIPAVADSGMSAIKSLPDDPYQCIHHLLVDNFYKNHFSNMIEHYCIGHPELKEKMRQFAKEWFKPEFILYRAKNGELAVKFPNQFLRDRFIKAMGGFIAYDKQDKYNAGKLCPLVFEDNNDTFYIPAYLARNGELAVIFPAEHIRDRFIQLLINAGPALISTYQGQMPLYINDNNIHKIGTRYHITVKLPKIICDEYVMNVAEVALVSRVLAQGQRAKVGLFNEYCFPKEIAKKIAYYVADPTILTEEEGRKVVDAHFARPKP